ncbi:MAG TPA: diaminopimelate epimerase [Saprospiraceae bacterium]|nr:diaminopimelate epimerase [Saprospiraceae bacterium]
MQFWKYQGAGNDFVMIDQRDQQWLSRADTRQIARLCDRHFGVGADGLILLQNCPGYDFEMIYFNSDGRESTMCGNGGRCIVAFAHHLGIIGEHGRFLAIDGPHEARIDLRADTEPGELRVELHMQDVWRIDRHGEAFVLNTGSPHYVRFADDIAALDMVQEGRAVRYSEPYRQEGINVNLVRAGETGFDIRTYERGVEDETLACGTGVTAAAIAWFVRQQKPPGNYHLEVAPVKAVGGTLAVHFDAKADGSFRNVQLIGPAQRVFSGTI